MPGRYTTVERVRGLSGVTPSALGVDDDAALDALLDEWIDDVEGLLEADRGRSYADDVDAGVLDGLPVGWEGLATRVAARLVRVAETHRKARHVDLDDAGPAQVGEEVLDAFRDELALYPGPTEAAGGRGRFRLFVPDPQRVLEDG